MAMIVTMIPATQYSGLTNPVSSMQGSARFIGEINPATYMFTISRGVFNKALNYSDISMYLQPMIIAAVVIVVSAILILRKQEK